MIEKPRLLDRLRDRIRLKHYSIRTEKAYLDWNRRFHAYPDVAHTYINLIVHVQDSPMYPCTSACKSVALPWPRFSVHYRKPLMARISD